MIIRLLQQSLIFNQKTNLIKFIELQESFDGNAINFSADEVLSNDLSEGIIYAAKLLLDDTIEIQTDKVRLKDGEFLELRGYRVTSCTECKGNILSGSDCFICNKRRREL